MRDAEGTFSQEVTAAATNPPRLDLPFGLSPVSAGFPSPAEDYAAGRLDLNQYLVRNPVSTFYFQVRGDSMENAQIFDGDILVVDRSIEACHGHIVVAFVNGERLVKRLYMRGGRVALLAENKGYPPLVLTEGSEMEIWGVVIGLAKRIPG